MPGDALLGRRVVVHLRRVQVAEERPAGCLGVRQRLFADANLGRLLGVVLGWGDRGAHSGRLRVGELDVTQLGDAGIETVGASVQV